MNGTESVLTRIRNLAAIVLLICVLLVGLVWPSIATSLVGMYDKLVKAFKSGEGIPWGEQSPLLFSNTCRYFKPFYEGMLLSILPPEVHTKLNEGGRLADVGCGQVCLTTT